MWRVHVQERRLTAAGNALALRVVRRHRLIELFLVKTLNLNWDEVHEEAEHMEHAVSDRLIDRIDRTFDMLAEQPLAGRSRYDLAPQLRSFPVGSYVIFYTPVPDGVELVRVMNGRQDIDADDMI